MLSRRVIAPVGIAAALVGLVAVAAATTPSGSGTGSATGSATNAYRAPVATASGGGAAAPRVYPSIVNVHLVSAQADLDRASSLVDRGKEPAASAAMTAAAAQTTAAWAAARYVIRTTPPPPPVGDRANGSGGTPAGGTYAAPPDTGLAVLTLQHDVITTSLGLLSSPDDSLTTELTATIQSTANARDAAIAYIHRVAPPAPPVGDRAGASGGAITSTWDSVMPGLLPILDDEIQALTGTRALTKGLPATVDTDLKAVTAQDRKTKATINKFWPPVVGDD
jgi:hypothetical protein